MPIPVPPPTFPPAPPFPHLTCHPLLREVKASLEKSTMTVLFPRWGRPKVFNPRPLYMPRLSKVSPHREWILQCSPRTDCTTEQTSAHSSLLILRHGIWDVGHEVVQIGLDISILLSQPPTPMHLGSQVWIIRFIGDKLFETKSYF